MAFEILKKQYTELDDNQKQAFRDCLPKALSSLHKSGNTGGSSQFDGLLFGYQKKADLRELRDAGVDLPSDVQERANKTFGEIKVDKNAAWWALKEAEKNAPKQTETLTNSTETMGDTSPDVGTPTTPSSTGDGVAPPPASIYTRPPPPDDIVMDANASDAVAPPDLSGYGAVPPQQVSDPSNDAIPPPVAGYEVVPPQQDMSTPVPGYETVADVIYPPPDPATGTHYDELTLKNNEEMTPPPLPIMYEQLPPTPTAGYDAIPAEKAPVVYTALGADSDEPDVPFTPIPAPPQADLKEVAKGLGDEFSGPNMDKNQGQFEMGNREASDLLKGQPNGAYVLHESSDQTNPSITVSFNLGGKTQHYQFSQQPGQDDFTIPQRGGPPETLQQFLEGCDALYEQSMAKKAEAGAAKPVQLYDNVPNERLPPRVDDVVAPPPAQPNTAFKGPPTGRFDKGGNVSLLDQMQNKDFEKNFKKAEGHNRSKFKSKPIGRGSGKDQPRQISFKENGKMHQFVAHKDSLTTSDNSVEAFTAMMETFKAAHGDTLPEVTVKNAADIITMKKAWDAVYPGKNQEFQQNIKLGDPMSNAREAPAAKGPKQEQQQQQDYRPATPGVR